MKIKVSFLLLLFVAVGFLTSPVSSQQKQAPLPSYGMGTFYMSMLVRGPEFTAEETPGMVQLRNQHIAYLQGLLSSGKGVIAGPLLDEGQIRGILVLNTASPEEAKALAEADPAVKAGRLAVEMHPWYAGKDVMKKAETPWKMVTYYIGLLRRGAKWTPEDTPEIQRLQEAHMANIRKMAELGKLVIAGPFSDGGEWRGVFVFKVNSLEEAKALAEADPAVKAGRLVVEVHPWSVPQGVLP